MTVIQLPEVKKKEFKGYTKDRLEEILQSNEELSQTIHHHIMFAQKMQEVGRWEEAQTQWNYVTQLLTALKNKS
jgi:hypothetical protein|tara:strand:- start:342 stop:563 length:222 start_codon:yes stop_codon:yes gene_type:complete